MLARHMQAALFVFRDIAQGVANGHSAFSNVDVRYRGSSDDAALNRGIAASPPMPPRSPRSRPKASGRHAAGCLSISIHSLNDPQVAVESQANYRAKVSEAGNGARLGAGLYG